MYNTLRDTDRDGYRNWAWRGQNANRRMLEEPMAHAHVAALAYALDVNRGLSSPSSINYGRLADNLLGYLRNDFEPKMRKVNNSPRGYPFMRAVLHHPYVNMMRYHHYMYKLTGERGYQDSLNVMSNVIRREVKDISTSTGKGVLWDQLFVTDPNNYTSSSDRRGTSPTLYATQTYSSVLDLHLEGVAPFDRNLMQKLATTLSHFILDGACTSSCRASNGNLQIDIGGGRDRKADDGTVFKTGIAKRSGFPTPSYNHYANWSYAHYAAFDTTRDQKITKVNLAAFEATEYWGTEQPRRGGVILGMVFALLQK
jgi:hypothetical protein